MDPQLFEIALFNLLPPLIPLMVTSCKSTGKLSVMSLFKIHFPWLGTRYEAPQILALTQFNPDYSGQALQFCQQWLADTQSFTLPTSGSTGPPKFITLTRAQLTASARLTGQALGLRAGMRALVCLNPAYIAGTMMLVRGLVLDLELWVVPPAGPPLAAFAQPDTVQALPLHFAAVVPLQLQTLLAEAEVNLLILNQMQAIIVGGAPVEPGLETALQAIAAPVYATYGMTETVSHVALRRLNGLGRTLVYTALPGITFGLDERGCLVIHAPELGLPEALVTNDRAELHGPSAFRWLGRADLVINSGGVKIQPEAVEAVVGSLLGPRFPASQWAAVGLPHPALGQQLVLVLENPPWPSALQTEFLAALGQALPRYHAPKRLAFWARFPQTATGKTDRRGLLAQLTPPLD
jgi:o-succinylbenzoate---CoA ligase